MEKSNSLLMEARSLRELGLAVHWVKPQSKQPVGSGWTTGPAKTWPDLKASYEEGFNVGVRTGEASLVPGHGYLACIDIDIKDARFQKAAFARLKELIGGVLCPEVRSGSGNGSHHLYCVTKAPFKMVTVEKHEGWEICIYSNGRQMVLPPSIHPNGRSYRWVRPLLKADDLPLFDFEGLAEKAETERPPSKRQKKGGSFAAPTANEMPRFALDETLDIRWLPGIPDDVRRAIVQGVGVEDRSAYLLKACHVLLSADLERDEILNVLTDPTTYLGKCAYEHAQTRNRNQAAAWVWRYTLSGVMRDRDPVQAFQGKAVMGSEIEIEGADLEKQSQALSEEVYRSEEHGFYLMGKNGAKIPDFDTLLRQFQEDHPYQMIADMKAVFIFNGTHYVDYTPFEIRGFAEDHFSPKPTEKIRSEFLSKVMANSITRRNFFTETTEGKLNFKNGVLDLNDHAVLSSHSSGMGFRGVLPYEYDPSARCSQFWAWIQNIMLGDRELIAILQEYMGYIIRGGEYRYHKALWLEGTGRNGKSTFIDVLKALIGVGNFSTISIKSLVGDKFAGASLDGKIANFSEETSPQELADSGPFKNLTGDGDLFVQKKYGDPYHFRNRAKLVMSYNTIPDLKDLSPGMLSRPIIVPFRKKIREDAQDHHIKERLFAELPGIFNFALRGWQRLETQNRFTRSDKSELALKRIEEESCNVFQWVENYVDFTSTERDFKRTSELYTSYRARERYAHSIVNFGRKLNRHPEMKKRASHTRGGNGFWGVILR